MRGDSTAAARDPDRGAGRTRIFEGLSAISPRRSLPTLALCCGAGPIQARLELRLRARTRVRRSVPRPTPRSPVPLATAERYGLALYTTTQLQYLRAASHGARQARHVESLENLALARRFDGLWRSPLPIANSLYKCHVEAHVPSVTNLEVLARPPIGSRDHLPATARPWRTLWNAGQSVLQIEDSPTVATVVDRLAQEYAEAAAPFATTRATSRRHIRRGRHLRGSPRATAGT
jgi:hypothetical protein